MEPTTAMLVERIRKLERHFDARDNFLMIDLALERLASLEQRIELLENGNFPDQSGDKFDQ